MSKDIMELMDSANEVAVYQNQEEFLEDIHTVESSTERIEHEIPSLTVLGLPREPIFLECYKERFPDADEKALGAAMDGSGIIIEDTQTNTILPLREFALKSLFDRAKISGSALTKLSKENLAYVLNMCIRTGEEKGLIVKVGNQVSAILSDGYRVLPADEIFNRAVSVMRNNKGHFIGGFISPEIFSGTWKLDNDDIVDVYKKALGYDLDWDVTPVVTVATSNVGASGANLFPEFQRGKIRFIIGRPLCVEHKGAASMDRVNENLGQMYALFSKAVKNLAHMHTVKILYPSNTFKNVAKRIGLPKKYALQALEDFEAFSDAPISNAHDIYMGMTEALFYAENDGRNKAFVASMKETLARALTLNWADYDMPYADWDIVTKTTATAA